MKILISQQLTISAPCIVAMHHEAVQYRNMKLTSYYAAVRFARKTITDTWAYSQPAFVSENTAHSYWAFTNEIDAMQFILSGHGVRAHIWPKNTLFTIYDYSASNVDA